jgi:signal transduction histidine kinase/PAS domain-containing protein
MDKDDLINFIPSVFWWQGFISAMLSFSNRRLKTDFLSDIISEGLEVFSHIQNSVNIAYYELVDGEFIFCKELKIDPHYSFNHANNLSILIENNIVATVLTGGKVFFQKSDSNIIPQFNLLLLPIYFSAKIYGIIFIYLNNTHFYPDNISINLISSHCHQFAAYISNYYLLKEVDNLNKNLSQKIYQKSLDERRKRAEISKILDSINTAILLIDRDTFQILNCNLVTLQILNCENEDLINKKRTDFISNNSELKNWVHLYSKGNCETNFITPNKTKLDIITHLREISIDDKIYLLESFIDITNVKITKNTLKKHTDLLIGLSDSTHSLLTIQDIEKAINSSISILGKATNSDRVFICKNFDNKEMSLKFEWLNKNIKAIKNNPELNKLNFGKPSTISYYNKLENELAIKINVKDFHSAEKRFLDSIGVKSLIAVPIKFDNEFWGIIGLNDCNTEREWSDLEERILKAAASSIGGIIQKERYIKELKFAKIKAEKSDKIKSDFLAQISHEIRTPLNTILNFSNIIEMEVEDFINDDLRSYFNSVRSAGARIVRTVDLILNMSEIQNGDYSPSKKEVNIFDIVQQIYYQLKPQAKLKNLDFQLKNFNQDLTVVTDDYAINQVFSNLIDNAIKFTEKGKVVVEYNQNENFHNIAIKDTGIGISKDYIPHLFTPFSQEEHGYTRRFEGNGLGLALVKQYCNYNNLHLSYTTKKNKGTTFIVSIPKK